MSDPRLRRVALLALVLAVVAAAFLAGGRWAPGASPSEGSSAPEPVVILGEEAQVYTCAMHPQVRSLDPDARCPICGMELIPVPRDELAGEGEEASDAPRLRVSARAAALMQVRTWPVERRAVHVPIRVFGQIEPDERRLASIAARVGGRIDALHVDFRGVRVERGQPVADLYSPALISAQEELLQARQMAGGGTGDGAASETAEILLETAREKLRLLGFDSEQIEEIEQRGAVSDHLTIRSPLSGTVLERNVATGDYVDTGQVLLRVADLSQLWLLLQVYEADLAWLRTGQTARFTAEAHPGLEFEGEVAFIDPVVDEDSRTVGVRVDVDHPEGLLKPGMFVRGTIEAGLDAAPLAAQPRGLHEPDAPPHADPERGLTADPARLPLVIPSSAPLLTGLRAVVYVQLPDAEVPTFEPRDVLLGPRARDWYVVREGLAEGELVVVNGQFRIDSELQIRGRPSMMAPGGNAAPVHDHGAAVPEDGAHTGHATVVREEVPSAFRSSLADLVRENFALVDALAADDLERARAAGASARAALAAIDAAPLEPDQRTSWSSQASELEGSLAALEAAGDLEQARAAFERFSEALSAGVRTFGVESIGTVYRAMCPMVQGRRGYWLQDERTIQNPYHGAAMLRCGEIVEEIASAESSPR